MKQVSAVLEHALGGRGSRRQLTLRVRKSRTKTTAAKSQFSEPSQRNEPRGGLSTGTQDVSWGKGMKSRLSRAAGRSPAGRHASCGRIAEREVQVGWGPESPFVPLGNSRGPGHLPEGPERRTRGFAGSRSPGQHWEPPGARQGLTPGSINEQT